MCRILYGESRMRGVFLSSSSLSFSICICIPNLHPSNVIWRKRINFNLEFAVLYKLFGINPLFTPPLAHSPMHIDALSVGIRHSEILIKRQGGKNNNERKNVSIFLDLFDPWGEISLAWSVAVGFR